MNLQSDDFRLLGVPMQFTQDLPVLEARWKELQRQVHPDRFAAQGAAAQRVAVQWSVRINEAYRRLRDPLQRAAYLCELHNTPVQAEDNTAMPTVFLMQQMELREQLDEADTPAALQALRDEVAALREQTLEQIARHIDGQQDWGAAAQAVRALMFMEKLTAQIQQRMGSAWAV